MTNMNQSSQLTYAQVDWSPEHPSQKSLWDPGFNTERVIVHTKFGPFRRLFEKPERFKKRFYHTIQPLTIERWDLNEHLELYDGFCTIDADLHLQYQATFNYYKQTHQVDPDVNAHIKSFYAPLIRDVVQSKLLNLTDGSWVKTGLGQLEIDIALSVNELFLAQDIQITTACSLTPFFKEFPDIKFKEQSIYLMALKKNYEIVDQKQQETFRQEQMLEQHRLEKQAEQLAISKLEHELELQKQAQLAEYKQKELREKELHQAEYFAIEQRLHSEQLKHESVLLESTFKENLLRQKQQDALKRQAELDTLDEKINHEQTIKARELAAQIKVFNLEQQQWQEAKAKWRSEENNSKLE